MTESSTAQITAREDDTVKRLSRIWEELLGIQSIGLDQNYFDLGWGIPPGCSSVYANRKGIQRQIALGYSFRGFHHRGACSDYPPRNSCNGGTRD